MKAWLTAAFALVTLTAPSLMDAADARRRGGGYSSGKSYKAKRSRAKSYGAYSGGGSSYYANCSAARAAGAAPVMRGDPGYSRKLDRDGDGVGCE